MLFWSQAVEQNVVLRAHTHVATYLWHLIKQVVFKDAPDTSWFREQARQQRDCRWLACSIVSKQYEDLAIIQLQIYSINSLKPVFIHFSKILNL